MSDVTQNPDDLCVAFSLPQGSVNVLGWMCNRCQLCNMDINNFCIQLEQDTNSSDTITRTRAEVAGNAVEKVRKDGIVFTKSIHSEFKQSLEQLQVVPSTKLMNTFTKYVDNIMKKHSFRTYTSPNMARMGKVVYNDKVFNADSTPFVFNQQVEKWKAELERENLQSFMASYIEITTNDQGPSFQVSSQQNI